MVFVGGPLLAFFGYVPFWFTETVFAAPFAWAVSEVVATQLLPHSWPTWKATTATVCIRLLFLILVALSGSNVDYFWGLVICAVADTIEYGIDLLTSPRPRGE